MEKIQKLILTTMVLILLVSVGYGADWKYYSTAPDGTNNFYDTKSIIREGGAVKAWEKEVLSDKAKAEWIDNYHEYSGIEKVNYVIYRWEIDCSKNRVRPMVAIVYDSEGDAITGVPLPSNTPFIDAVPESPVFLLVESICKKGEAGK